MTSLISPPGLHADWAAMLHNSGPSTHAVYRTGGVGLEHELSPCTVITELVRGTGLQGYFLARHGAKPNGALLPGIVEAGACAALTLMGETPRGPICMPSTSRVTHAAIHSAVERLGELKALLAARDLLLPLHGLVKWKEVPGYMAHPSPQLFPWMAPVSPDLHVSLAWALMAMACASPPIVLLSRAPSLSWFRAGGVMQVRWFGAGSATGATKATAP